MAGTWDSVEKVGVAAYCGGFQSMFSVKRTFTADSSDGSVPDWEIDDTRPAFLADIGVVLDAVTPPTDTLKITVKDIDGLIVAEQVFAASERVALTDRPSVIGGTTVSVSENAVNGAKAKVILNFANNLR